MARSSTCGPDPLLGLRIPLARFALEPPKYFVCRPGSDEPIGTTDGVHIGGVIVERYRREVDGLTFVPIRISPGVVDDLLVFNPLRTLRPMPQVRPIPESGVLRGAVPPLPPPIPQAPRPPKKLKPARKQVKAGDVVKTETVQTGKEYSTYNVLTRLAVLYQLLTRHFLE